MQGIYYVSAEIKLATGSTARMPVLRSAEYLVSSRNALVPGSLTWREVSSEPLGFFFGGGGEGPMTDLGETTHEGGEFFSMTLKMRFCT